MRRRLPAVVVALAAAAVYARTAGFQFVYDDVPIILENDRLHAVSRWPELLTSPWWPRGLYRPFTSLTLAVDWLIGGGSPVPFHVFNLLAHVGASLLVLVLAGTLMSPPAALAAALVFAVHPIHVEAVASVVGRAEVLATLFALAAALLYRAHGRADLGPGQSRAALAAAVIAALLLALASKESAFATPALLLLMDWAGAREEGVPPATRFRRHAGLWGATVVLTAAWLLLRARILGGLAGDYPAPGLGGTTPWQRLLIMLPLVPEYVRLFLFPARLSSDYSPNFVPASPVFTARSLLGLGVLAGVVGLAIAGRRRAVPVTFGIAWIGAALLVIGNVLVPSGVLVAERTLYLASVGACLALGWGWGWVLERRADAAWALLLVAATAGRRPHLDPHGGLAERRQLLPRHGPRCARLIPQRLGRRDADLSPGRFGGRRAPHPAGAGDLRRQRRHVAGLCQAAGASAPLGRGRVRLSAVLPGRLEPGAGSGPGGGLLRPDRRSRPGRQRAGRGTRARGRLERDRHRRLAPGARPGRRGAGAWRCADGWPGPIPRTGATGSSSARPPCGRADCPDLSESIGRLERLAPPAAARRTTALRDSAAAHNCTPATQ